MLFSLSVGSSIHTKAAAPKVGVMFSEASEKYAKIERPGGMHKGLTVSPKIRYSSTLDKQLKLYHLYEQQGFNPIKVTEKDLLNRDYIGSFDTIVFPYTVQMNHAQRQAVKEYIRDGGGVIFAFTPARNESSVFPAAGKLDLTPLIYHTETWIWEWDNLSEVFQSGFVNDVVLHDYKIGAAGTHAITRNAERELGRKLELTNTRSSGDWIEVIEPYSGYVVPLLEYKSFSKSSSPIHTPKNTGAAHAMEFGKGRIVYAGFKIYDHLGIDADAPWEDNTRGLAYDGTTGSEDAKAFFKHAAYWTSGEVNKVRPQTYSVAASLKDLRGYLRAGDYSVYGTATIENDGVTPTRGTIVVELSNANGKVLASYERYKPGYTPKSGRPSGPQWSSKESILEEKFHFQLPKNIAHGQYKLSATFHEGKDGKGYRIKSTVKDLTIGKGNAQFTDPKMFKDVSSKNGALDDIKNLSNLGIIRGFPDGSFKPGNNVTRIQAAEMILKSVNIPVRTGLSINATDIKRGDYGYDIIATAVQNGILTVDNGKVRAHTAMTRGEMARSLIGGFKFEAYANESFEDVAQSNRDHQAIVTIYALGVTTGYPDGTFKPNTTVSRQQFSAFINRSLTAVQK